MTSCIRHIRLGATRRRLVTALAGSVLGTVLAVPALAGGFLDESTPKEPEKPTWAVPAKRLPVEGEGVDAAEARLKNAEMRLREAEQNADTAEWAYTRARTRRYPRGEALQEIEDRVTKTKEELAAARQEFVELVETSRREGMPAGTLMPYMDIADEIRRKQSQDGSDQ